ncbi:MAG TPA: glycoside hydrolase family 13 protein [Actinotalea sp.]|nr:glycoside hydrolase family 13 protein [Actinotalea sp.]
MTQWWRDAVVYQVYPRSFADADGDGLGDLRGITERLDHLAWLGVDALWISPCFASPQVDHGYDISDYRAIDPLFGSLADMDALLAAAHARGIRVTLDFVPNHTSDQHAWFRAAVTAGPGSPERARYLFLDGRGPDGALPPTNWRSVFGGPSWTRVTEPDGTAGQWYYHLFAAEQPDLNWRHPAVLAEFELVLRFWLDRGVDGFRIDVSDALIKDDAWPDTPDGTPVIAKDASSPVHGVYRALRRVLDAYPGDRMAVVETGAPDDVVALFVRPDEMHLAFNFRFVHAGFDGPGLRAAIDESLAANALVGAPTTWVTDNHDTPRSVSRLGAGGVLAGAYVPGATAAGTVDLALGARRARAIALVLLALPGAAYVYNGQELGLPQVEDLPDGALQDPIWERSGRTSRGRDGCRIPVPWSGERPPYGFSPEGSGPTWLPMPEGWAALTVEAQRADPGSMLHLYRDALAARRASGALGRGRLTWPDEAHGGTAGLLAFDLHGARETVRVVLNLLVDPAPLPPGEVLLSSAPVVDGLLPGESTAWVRHPQPPG